MEQLGDPLSHGSLQGSTSRSGELDQNNRNKIKQDGLPEIHTSSWCATPINEPHLKIFREEAHTSPEGTRSSHVVELGSLSAVRMDCRSLQKMVPVFEDGIPSQLALRETIGENKFRKGQENPL